MLEPPPTHRRRRGEAQDRPDTADRIPDLVRSTRTLWVVGLVAVLGDLVTTVYGLEIGLREKNPVVAGILVAYGVPGLVALKLVAISWVVVIWRVLSRRYGVAALAGLALPQSVAAGLNVVTILTV